MKKDIMEVLDKEVEQSKDFDDFVGAVFKSVGTTILAPLMKKIIKQQVENRLKNINFWK